jgi:hypothetical protein
MQAAPTTTLFLLLGLAAAPAQAQTNPPNADAIRSSLGRILSIMTLGGISVQEQAAEVTQHGADYQVRLPLADFSAPPDAAVTAVAHRVQNGMLHITAMTLPSAGTLETASAGDPAGQITYSVGEQRITAKVDPSLTVPSSYEAEFGHVRLSSDQGEQHGEQSFDRYTVNGTLSGDQEGRVSMASQGSGTGFHFVGHGQNGFVSDASARALAGHFSVEGLNRDQGTRLMTALRGVAGSMKMPGRGPDVSAEQRAALHAMVEAADGLMSRLEVEEALEGVRFAAGAGAGTIGRVRLTAAGMTREQRLDSEIGIALDGISSSAVSAENAAFMPHHVDIKTYLRGVQVNSLMALLHAATEPGADPVMLQAQATALLADPHAHVGIETLVFDCGPLRIKGSASVVPHSIANGGANGREGPLGAELHIAARGLDAFLAQAQSQPNLKGIMPMLFMAKGMGRAQDESIVWDISLGDGPIRINGVPFGQPADNTR